MVEDIKRFDNSPKMWLERIRKGIIYKEKYGDSKNWGIYEKYFRGDFAGYTRNTKGILPLNIVFSIAKTLIPNTYFRNPYINVTPRKGVFVDFHRRMMARVVESVDNWLVQEIDLKQVIKQAIRSAYFTGTGIIKCGYDSQFGFFPSVLDNAQLTKDSKEKTEYNVNIKPGMPWFASVPSAYFIVPFGGVRMKELPWVDHVSLRPLWDVKTDVKYKNTEKLKGTHVEMLQKALEDTEFYKSLTNDASWVEVHEIRDAKRRQIMCVVTGQDWWLRPPEEDALQIDGLPYTDIHFNEDDKVFWSVSDVGIIEPQQLEINESRTQAMYHRRVALLRFAYEKGAIKKGELAKLLQEDVGVGIEMDDDPRKLAMIQPHIPADIVQWTDVIRSDAREQLGIGRQQTGELGRTRRTAKESEIVDVASQTRLSERRGVVGDAVAGAVRKANQTIFKFWKKEKVVQVVGVDAAKYWVAFNNEAISGEYDLKVDVESMTPVTRDIRRREVMQLLAVMAKMPQANVTPLLRQLSSHFDFTDSMELFPEAQETQGKPMGMQEFSSQQQSLSKDPQRMAARVGQNKRFIEGAMR